MKIRADIAELIHQGFNNAEIARKAGVSPQKVSWARRRLNVRNAPTRRDSTALERLYAEALPTGRVKDFQPVIGDRLPLSSDQQAANRAVLLAALKEAA